MRARLLVALLLVGVCADPRAQAQRATERYVPIGRSPGLSGVSTVIGTVEAVDAASGLLRVRAAAEIREVQTQATTRIWLDRSARGESSASAELLDCRAGAEVEVKLAPDGRSAEWIKVRASPDH